MPAVEAVAREELAAAGARERDGVLDVGHRSRYGAERRRVERPARRGEEEDCRCSAHELESPRVVVLVPHPVAGEVRKRTERERPEPGAGERPAGGAGGDVESDDHPARSFTRDPERKAVQKTTGFSGKDSVAVRKAFLLVVLLAAVIAPPASAQESPTTTGPPPEQPKIPDGVTVAGLAVGGMAPDQAHAAIQAHFDRPLRFRFGARRWQRTPAQLNAQPYVAEAVAAALAAQPGTALPLAVAVDAAAVRRYVAGLDRFFSRPPRNSVLSLRYLRPYLTRARTGIDVRFWPMTRAIVRALQETYRGPIPLQVRILLPRITRANFGPVVVIRRGSRRLYLYRGMRFVRRLPIAVGMPRYPTPIGRFRIVTKYRNPTWYPPNSDWASGLGPVPPGAGNPLGTRWMGLSAPGIGIHGTPAAYSIGTAASHGCIRMYIRQAEWLFERVRIGTPVFIVRP